MTALTASILPRAAICPPTVVLPQVKGRTSKPAGRGIAIHGFLEAVPALGREEALARTPAEFRAACEVIDLERLPPLSLASAVTEVTYALHVDTGAVRELGRNLGRDYSGRREGEICGTADYVALTADGRCVFVADWKTGRGLLQPARMNLQIRFLALCAARLYGRDEAVGALVHIREDGTPWYDSAAFDVFDLDATLAEVRHVAARVVGAWAEVQAGITPTVTISEFCKHCPAYEACPAQVGLIRHLGASPEATERDMRGLITEDNVREAYRRMRLIEEGLKRVKEAIHGWTLTHSPIDLGEGLVYGPVETHREQVDGAVVRRILAEKYGQEIADAACEWSSSKVAIREALRRVVQLHGGKLAPLEREVLEAVRAAGGIEDQTSVNVKEYRPLLRKGDRAA